MGVRLLDNPYEHPLQWDPRVIGLFYPLTT